MLPLDPLDGFAGRGGSRDVTYNGAGKGAMDDPRGIESKAYFLRTHGSSNAVHPFPHATRPGGQPAGNAGAVHVDDILEGSSLFIFSEGSRLRITLLKVSSNGSISLKLASQ